MPNPGDVIHCPNKACGRKTRIKRDGKIAKHYWFNRNHCKLSDQPYPEA